MTAYGVAEAKDTLPKLIDRALAGEEVAITRYGKPVVRRAVQTFELGTEEEAAELRTRIDAFNELHPETLRIADESHRKVAEIFAGATTRSHTTRRRKETAAAWPLRRRDQGAAPGHPARRAD